jgi:uncharacterized protein YkwD
MSAIAAMTLLAQQCYADEDNHNIMNSQYISPNKSDLKEPSELIEKKKSPKARAKDLSVAQLELRMFESVNNDRAKAGASPVQQSALLAKLARLQADDMLKHNMFSHNSADGLDTQQRAKRSGIIYGVYENIADQAGPDPATQMVDEIDASFMAEPPNQSNHRSNLLSPQHTHVGIGIAKSKDHVIVVQDFTNHDPTGENEIDRGE